MKVSRWTARKGRFGAKAVRRALRAVRKNRGKSLFQGNLINK